jgi:type VI secretion system secreted protein Hcp
MAVDIFLKLTDIDGEAQDKTHGDEIDVLAWSWGMSQAGTFHTGGGGGAGKADYQDISVTKYVDKSSMTLMEHVATGRHIPEATLVVRKSGDQPLEYLTIKMTKVMVTSLSTGGSGGEEQLTENISLNFAEVESTYVQQTEKGAAGAEVLFKRNIAKNE